MRTHLNEWLNATKGREERLRKPRSGEEFFRRRQGGQSRKGFGGVIHLGCSVKLERSTKDKLEIVVRIIELLHLDLCVRFFF